jgi:uncharacterized protein (DUF3084 family)
MAPLYKPPTPQPTADSITALETALMLLVDTLSRKGVFKLEDYRDSLREMWEDMPAEDAGSEPGRVFERLLSNLADAIAERDRRAARKQQSA